MGQWFRAAVAAALVLALGAFCAPVLADKPVPEVTDQQVVEALKKGVEYLLNHKTPVYAGKADGMVPITAVSFRKYTVIKRGLATEPRLLGVKRNGRYVILFSDSDITEGLVDNHVWGVLGYTPESAEAITRNELLYVYSQRAGAGLAGTLAAGQKAVAATRPATRP